MDIMYRLFIAQIFTNISILILALTIAVVCVIFMSKKNR